MHRYGWTLSDHTQVILDVLDEDPDISWVIGSSFGAFAAVMALEQRVDRHVKAILLAPAMNFADVMSHRLGSVGLMNWKNTNTLTYEHRGVGRWVELPFDLWAQSHRGSDAIVVHLSVVIHGVHDDVISIDVSRRLEQRSSGIIELMAVDDDHGLNRSLSAIGQAVARLDAYTC